MADIVLPATADQVVELLNQRFPDRCPDPKDPEREVWMKAGERRVVQWLLELRRRRDDNLLDSINVSPHS